MMTILEEASRILKEKKKKRKKKLYSEPTIYSRLSLIMKINNVIVNYGKNTIINLIS